MIAKAKAVYPKGKPLGKAKAKAKAKQKVEPEEEVPTESPTDTDHTSELRDLAKSRLFNSLWRNNGLPEEAKLLIEEAQERRKQGGCSYRQDITKISNALFTKKGGRFEVDTQTHPMFTEARQRVDRFKKAQKVQGIVNNTS